MDGEVQQASGMDAGKGALLVLFLVTMIDMIGFGIVIPFLTYLVEDLAIDQNITSIGIWVGLLMTSYSVAQFLFSPIWGGLSDRIGRRPVLMIGLWEIRSFHNVWSCKYTFDGTCAEIPSRCFQWEHCCCSCLHW